jgi:non-specific serine/threonine protein kinase
LAEVSEASSIPLAIAAARQACNYSAERQPAVSIHAPVELLVLDTVEHLPGAAEQVLGLLRDTAGLRVLVTSVRPLDIPGERVIRLGGLGGPADEHRPFEETTESASPGRGSTADSPCVRLYEERARATSASFRLNAPDIDVLHQMCDLLGRIPLTIELAASRVVTVPPALLLARLREDGGLDALRTGRMSDGPVRHQTMHRALTWSYELLEPRARELLAALSVFPGSFTTTGAAELVGDQAPPPGTPPGATTSATGSRH